MKQTRYIQTILEKFGIHYSKPKAIPSILGLISLIDMESPPLENPNMYRQIVGSRIYAMIDTRPDVCYI